MLIIKNNQNEFNRKNTTKFYKMLLKFKLLMVDNTKHCYKNLLLINQAFIKEKTHDDICRGNKYILN